MTEPETPPAPSDGSPPGPEHALALGASHPPTRDAPDAPAAGWPPPPTVEPLLAAPAPWRRYIFLAVLSVASLALDLGTKTWARGHLEGHRRVEVVTDHLYFIFARNRGGAWGLLQNEPESVRRPFFVVVSVLAIVFIVSLYRRLTPEQWALKWGLPLVLGGALGNLINRIQFNFVVDFIDFRADWVAWLNGVVSGSVTDHWPTFNVADVAIVAGVALMGIDMFTTRKTPKAAPVVAAGGGDAAAAPGTPQAPAEPVHGGAASGPTPQAPAEP